MGSNTASRCFDSLASPLLLAGLAVALLAVGCAQESSQETSQQDAPTTQATSTTQASPTTQATSTTQASSTSGQADAEEESASVPSDMFDGSVSLTGGTADVEFEPVFSLNRRVGCRLCISPVASGGGDHIGGYVLELRDASGMAVRSVPFNVLTVIGRGELDDGTPVSVISDSFEFVVSDPPVYESFAVMRDGVELGSVSRSRNAPSISVSGPSWDMFDDDGTISVSWVGSDADGDDLVYRVFYSTNGGSFYRRMFHYKIKDTSKSFPATRLRGSSRARIGVSVSDGTRSVFAETPVFSVAGHEPPR